jgi:DUF4097 and DUF4098 domain-containing protein YvlB
MSAKRAAILSLAGLLLTPSWSRAERVLEERRQATPDGIVEIENQSGSVKVSGWEKNEVAVKAWVGEGVDGIDVHASGGRIRIEIETRGNPFSHETRLEVSVPAASRVELETFASSVAVQGVTGVVRAETVNGAITVTGGPREVDLHAVNGPIEVSGGTSLTKVEAVNGTVTVRGAGGRLDASTVNGRLVVSGGSFDRVRLETVSAAFSFEGSLSPRAVFEAETVSGGAELLLPAGIGADFSLSSFSGEIKIDFDRPASEGGKPAGRHHGWTPEKEVSFTSGAGGAKISVRTLSGPIRIAKKP